jgi:hypothetical protein
LKARNWSGLRVIATVLFVFGCVAAGPGVRPVSAQAIQCPGASCDVSVTMSGNPPFPVANDVKMKKGQANPVITWKLLNAPDYEFRRDSIKPHTGAPAGNKKTTTQAAWDAQITFQNSNATQFKAKNKNSVATELHYDVTVYHKATGTAYTLDPIIFNDP